MINQKIIETIKYLNFCGLCTTGDCKNCARKIAKDKVLLLLELEREMIDEKKLIEDIKEWSNEREIKWTSESIISLLESAHKINDWIPCDNEENLPKEEMLVDCTIKRTLDNHIWVENLIYNPFEKKWKWTDYPEDRYVNEDTHKILAWKYKSEPYISNER